MISPGETLIQSVPNSEANSQPAEQLSRLQRAGRFAARTALSLSVAVAGGAALGTTASTLTEPAAARAAEFVDDYPHLGAPCYPGSIKYRGGKAYCADWDWRVPTKDEGGNITGWPIYTSRGFWARNCVDGVAYWAKKYTGTSIHGSTWKSASNWNEAASSIGHLVKPGNSNGIEPGDIAQSDDGANDHGHVGFVTQTVKDNAGNVIRLRIAELNKAGTGNSSHDWYETKNSSGNFKRDDTKDWDHFIDLNGIGKGLNNENLGSGTQPPRASTDKIHELGFVRTNHFSGNAELLSYRGTPYYNVLNSNEKTGYPAITDPQNVTPLAIDVNGDGIDELGFVRTNHSSGNTELVLYHGAPHYKALLNVIRTGYPAISDPEHVTPIAIDLNGDNIDELGFVRTNHGSGRTELVAYGGAGFDQLQRAVLTGYPAIGDPQNVTPLAIDTNGDGRDELGFVRTNHGSGKSEIVAYGGQNYDQLIAANSTGYPAITDPQNVTVLAMDLNGDKIDELAFLRTNHSSGKTEMLAYHGSPRYTVNYIHALTGYPAIGDPQNVRPLALHLP